MCFPSFSPGAPWLTQGIAFKVSGSNLPYYPLQCQRKIINFANNLHDSIYVAQPDIILCNQITHLFFFFFFVFEKQITHLFNYKIWKQIIYLNKCHCIDRKAQVHQKH